MTSLNPAHEDLDGFSSGSPEAQQGINSSIHVMFVRLAPEDVAMARSKQIRKITIATAVVLLPYVTYADFAVKGMGMQFAHLGPTHDPKQS